MYAAPPVWIKFASFVIMGIVYAFAANGIVRHPPPTYIQMKFGEPLLHNWRSIVPRLALLWFYMIFPMLWPSFSPIWIEKSASMMHL